MKQKIFVALLALAFAVLTHGYLTAHYYPLHLGFGGGNTLCQVGAKFDCDAVSASPFASIAGVPIAALGAVYNAVLFLMVLLTWFGLRGEAGSRWRAPLWLATGSLVASVVMGVISLAFLSSFCLFCLIAYGLSIVAFVALLLAQESPPWPHFVDDLSSWFTTQRGFLFWLALVPVGAFFVHTGMMQTYGANELGRVVQSSVSDWKSRTAVTWTAVPSLAKGASVENAKMTITEFADFRCGHCKHAVPSLNAFVKANPDVRLVFYSFPLDSTCNPALQQGDGVSCQLAKFVFCANKQEKGWVAHDLIFENQGLFQTLTSKDTVSTELKAKMEPHGLDWAAAESCLKDPEVDKIITAQAEQGATAKVAGTPTVYVNGKKLERGQLVPVLNAVRDDILKNSRSN